MLARRDEECDRPIAPVGAGLRLLLMWLRPLQELLPTRPSFRLLSASSMRAKLLGVSRSAAYRAAASGQLPTLAFGRRLLVPTAPLLRMLGVSFEENR
jgi:hypothetical protein